ncbi:hypothetical protein [Antrihabitans sp. YC2-6]|uniref:hypothetical protein n=1 Tax=Antrihabitans sp. YC2-6 TaxID=2799498 RepID=UPI0018F29C29|nr:hypothetical protein [Antrihabitans sp. YC2-6]MBJ8348369.1 hypothetical protein [Antrihabitans sp. YC2-6]
MGDTHAPWSAERKKWVAAGLFAVSILAVVASIVGLLAQPDAARPSASESTSSETPAAPSTTGIRVTPPVVYPTTIPGCETVDPPPDNLGLGSWASFGGSQSYDNPKFPWFSDRKAVAMSNAIRAALPASVEVEFASPTGEFLFGPIIDFEEPTDVPEGLSGWTDASGQLLRGDVQAQLWVQVRQADNVPPPCIAGALDERRTLADGAVLDISDDWSEFIDERTTTRSVVAYFPDGTRLRASMTKNESTADANDDFPLTVDELVAIAVSPGLRVTTPIPDGTSEPPISCSVADGGDGTNITREDVRRLNEALESHWRANPIEDIALDRPIRSLQLADNSRAGVCGTWTVVTPGREGQLSLSIVQGQPLPEEKDVYDPEYSTAPTVLETLDDGSVVTATESEGQQYISVARTLPSGVQVTASSRGLNPLSIEQLRSIAEAPGLEMTR